MRAADLLARLEGGLDRDLLADGWVDRSWDIALHEVRALLTRIDGTGELPLHGGDCRGSREDSISGASRQVTSWKR